MAQLTMLDTDICAFLLRRACEVLAARVQAVPLAQQVMSVVSDAAIRDALKRKEAMLGANDLMIAAHGRSMGATVVTNNSKDFRRVPGLSIDNWTR